MDVRGYGRSTRPAEMSAGPHASSPLVRSSEVVRDLAAVVAEVRRQRDRARRAPRLGGGSGVGRPLRHWEARAGLWKREVASKTARGGAWVAGIELAAPDAVGDDRGQLVDEMVDLQADLQGSETRFLHAWREDAVAGRHRVAGLPLSRLLAGPKQVREVIMPRYRDSRRATSTRGAPQGAPTVRQPCAADPAGPRTAGRREGRPAGRVAGTAGRLAAMGGAPRGGRTRARRGDGHPLVRRDGDRRVPAVAGLRTPAGGAFGEDRARPARKWFLVRYRGSDDSVDATPERRRNSAGGPGCRCRSSWSEPGRSSDRSDTLPRRGWSCSCRRRSDRIGPGRSSGWPTSTGGSDGGSDCASANAVAGGGARGRGKRRPFGEGGGGAAPCR